MLSGVRALIVEDEFIIALEIQRVLESDGAASSAIAGNYRAATALLADGDDFDLAIIALTPSADGLVALCAELSAQGVAIVATTADGAYRVGIPELPNVDAIIKPFSDEDLVAACRAALFASLRSPSALVDET